MNRPRLSLAINDSDHVRDLVTGVVPVEGVELNAMVHAVEEIFFRLTKFREWDISEMSLGKYSAMTARGDDNLVGLPIFLSRSFRHSGIFTRADGPVDDPAALRGGRIGIPEWTVTATVYQRALLAHEYGIPLDSVEWVQGGINEPGRIETLPVSLPEGIRVRPEREASLNDLMLRGDLDAMLVPHPPAAFTDRSDRIVQLFANSRQVEQDYFARTGVFPIMHLVVMRRDVHEQHPWLAQNLVTAFTTAKDRSLERMFDYTAAHTPIPWAVDSAFAAEKVFGADPWPYGIEPNRVTLDAFLSYAYEQGLCERRLECEELFPPSVREVFAI